MTRIYLDATPLITLGTIGELELLTSFDGMLVVLPAIQHEVTTEPAATNLERLLEGKDPEIRVRGPESEDNRTMELLGETEANGDVRIVSAVLSHTEADEPVAVVSDDRRLRTISLGLGARASGTIGVIVNAVETGLAAEEGKTLVRQVDEHGLHMTGELREKADELIDRAEAEREEI